MMKKALSPEEKLSQKMKKLQLKEKKKLQKAKAREKAKQKRLKQAQVKEQLKALKKDPVYQTEQRAKKLQQKQLNKLRKEQQKAKNRIKRDKEARKKAQLKVLKADPQYQAQQQEKKLQQKHQKKLKKMQQKEKNRIQKEKSKIKQLKLKEAKKLEKFQLKQLKADPAWREQQRQQKLAQKLKNKEKKQIAKMNNQRKKVQQKQKKLAAKASRPASFLSKLPSKVKATIIVFLLLMVSGIGGYGAYSYLIHPNPGRVTSHYLNAYQQENTSRMAKYGDDQFHFLNTALVNDPQYEPLKALVEPKIRDFDYQVEQYSINQDQAEVVVTITTTDLGSAVRKGIQNYLDHNYVALVAGKTSDDEMQQRLVQAISATIDTSDKNYTQTITVYAYKADDKWHISDLSQTNAQLAKMMTAGMYQ